MCSDTIKKPYTVQQIDAAGPDFNEVLALRCRAYGRDAAGIRDAVDEYSLHFAARDATGVIGAMRVTLRKHGPLESEEHYPRWILEEFGNHMCAASRMCVRPDLAGLTSIPSDLKRFAWPVILPAGVRIDVTKARINAIPFYMKLGYYFVRSSVFRFDKWDGYLGLIAFPANQKHRSRFSDLFANLVDPCDLDSSTNSNEFIKSYRAFIAMTSHLEAA